MFELTTVKIASSFTLSFSYIGSILDTNIPPITGASYRYSDEAFMGPKAFRVANVIRAPSFQCDTIEVFLMMFCQCAFGDDYVC